MLVQVALPIAKPLCHGSYILGTDGEHTLVKFKYERLPIFCHFFGLQGHDLRHYANHFAAEKKGGEVVYQYGDWLKAVGSQTKLAQTRESGRHNASDGNEGPKLELPRA